MQSNSTDEEVESKASAMSSSVELLCIRGDLDCGFEFRAFDFVGKPAGGEKRPLLLCRSQGFQVGNGFVEDILRVLVGREFLQQCLQAVPRGGQPFACRSIFAATQMKVAECR